MPLAAALFHCLGALQKRNWLLVRHVPLAQRCVVFFPGDISDFARPSSDYRFSLEGLMWVLCSKFPEETVVLVKPRHMLDFFAIYVNFMMVDQMGNPRPIPEPRRDADEPEGQAEPELEIPDAVGHLEGLLESLQGELQEAIPNRLLLVGFSKGAAVLNALLRQSDAGLWQHVEAVHFVDAGLFIPGVFPVSLEALKGLARHVPEGFTVWLHATPRQLEDPERPFVAEELEAFAVRCAAAGLGVQRRVYCRGCPVGLEMHFDSLRCFETAQGEASGDRFCGFFASWKEGSS